MRNHFFWKLIFRSRKDDILWSHLKKNFYIERSFATQNSLNIPEKGRFFVISCEHLFLFKKIIFRPELPKYQIKKDNFCEITNEKSFLWSFNFNSSRKRTTFCDDIWKINFIFKNRFSPITPIISNFCKKTNFYDQIWKITFFWKLIFRSSKDNIFNHIWKMSFILKKSFSLKTQLISTIKGDFCDHLWKIIFI